MPVGSVCCKSTVNSCGSGLVLGRPSGRAPTTEHIHLTVSLVWHGPNKAAEGATPQSGTECVAHIVQALTSMDENATLLSIDGVEGSPVGRIPQSHSTTQLQKVSMAMTRSQLHHVPRLGHACHQF